jgi:hypothetical protein
MGWRWKTTAYFLLAGILLRVSKILSKIVYKKYLLLGAQVRINLKFMRFVSFECDIISKDKLVKLKLKAVGRKVFHFMEILNFNFAQGFEVFSYV